MSQQHTPAPWTYEPASGWLAGKDTWDFVGPITGSGQIEVDCVFCSEADARLICAAPELLDACKASLALMADLEKSNTIQINQPGRLCADQVRAAIAKAEGKN